MPNEGECAPMRASISDEIVAEHLRLTTVERHEPGDESQQGGLARPVRTGEKDHFTLRDVEIDACKCRKPAEEAHGGAETDDGLHSASGGREAKCTKALPRRANRRGHHEGPAVSQPLTRRI